MKRILVRLVVLFGLAGCVNFDEMRANVASHIGHPVDNLIARIGYPTNDVDLNSDRKLLIWETSQNVSYISNVPSYNGQTGVSTYTPVVQSAHYFCNITVEVSTETHLITGMSVGGNYGCNDYAERLKR